MVRRTTDSTGMFGTALGYQDAGRCVLASCPSLLGCSLNSAHHVPGSTHSVVHLPIHLMAATSPTRPYSCFIQIVAQCSRLLTHLLPRQSMPQVQPAHPQRRMALHSCRAAGNCMVGLGSCWRGCCIAQTTEPGPAAEGCSAKLSCAAAQAALRPGMCVLTGHTLTAPALPKPLAVRATTQWAAQQRAFVSGCCACVVVLAMPPSARRQAGRVLKISCAAPTLPACRPFAAAVMATLTLPCAKPGWTAPASASCCFCCALSSCCCGAGDGMGMTSTCPSAKSAAYFSACCCWNFCSSAWISASSTSSSLSASAECWDRHAGTESSSCTCTQQPSMSLFAPLPFLCCMCVPAQDNTATHLYEPIILVSIHNTPRICICCCSTRDCSRQAAGVAAADGQGFHAVSCVVGYMFLGQSTSNWAVSL